MTIQHLHRPSTLLLFSLLSDPITFSLLRFGVSENILESFFFSSFSISKINKNIYFYLNH